MTIPENNQRRVPEVWRMLRKEEPKLPKSTLVEDLTRAQQLFQGQQNPIKFKKRIRLEQWVEVTIVDGKTVTLQVPTNIEMIRKGQTMWPPPDHVYRRIFFPQGVPMDYRWLKVDDPAQYDMGIWFIQRVTIDDWLLMIEREEKTGTGHIGRPIRDNLLAEPGARVCYCPSCRIVRRKQELKLKEELAAK